MKDYILSLDKNENYILKYEIKNDNIVIYFSKERKKIIPYTIENEKELLKIIKQQVIYSKVSEEKIKQNLVNLKLLALVFLLLSIATITTIALNNIGIIWPHLLLLSISSSISGIYISKIKKSKMMLDNIHKNKLFSEKVELNNYSKSKEGELSKKKEEEKNLSYYQSSIDIPTKNNYEEKQKLVLIKK